MEAGGGSISCHSTKKGQGLHRECLTQDLGPSWGAWPHWGMRQVIPFWNFSFTWKHLEIVFLK